MQKEHLASRHKSVSAKLSLTKCIKAVVGSIHIETDDNVSNVEIKLAKAQFVQDFLIFPN